MCSNAISICHHSVWNLNDRYDTLSQHKIITFTNQILDVNHYCHDH